MLRLHNVAKLFIKLIPELSDLNSCTNNFMRFIKLEDFKNVAKNLYMKSPNLNLYNRTISRENFKT